jgi:aspartyl-tRNA(Asn)/glutamyl-tRNA(Gln) amidotransferase subunit B
MEWETVIGLEVHCQLNTVTKLFCGCATSFGDAPNTHTCQICLGHPGVLPVLNKVALEKAVLAAMATECTVNPFSKFDRKNYFYPDLPKAYQITQFEKPVAEWGKISIPVDEGKSSRDIRIRRIHMEEDAGKLMHSQIGESYVDLNRAGTPLIEIVSEPDLSNSEEAVTYLQKLRSIMLYIGVSDCNMEEGSLRCDANVSIRPRGEKKLGDRTEIKNMNTFKGLRDAIEVEIKRQKKILEGGGRIVTETLLYDAAEKKTRAMRSKEEAHDYRYFPEPDLIPIRLSAAEIARIKATLPELPDAKHLRFVNEYKLSPYDATVLVADQDLAYYYEDAVKACPSEPKKICNWIMTEVNGYLNEKLLTIKKFPVKAAHIGGLIKSVSSGVINGKIAKDIFPEMIETGKSADEIVESKGLKQVTDTGAIQAAVEKVIRENADAAERYRGGNTKLMGFFVGLVMKETGGKANPQIVNDLVKSLLS